MSQVISPKNSLFLMSKSDQLSNVPYNVVTDAINVWINYVKSLDDEGYAIALSPFICLG